jgi:hypothetical protein
VIRIPFSDLEQERRQDCLGVAGFGTATEIPAIELFIPQEDARRALEGLLRDEPQWSGRLEVTEVELDHDDTSLN